METREKVMSYGEILVWCGVTVYFFTLLGQTGEMKFLIAAFAALFAGFNQADRNVYVKRLESLLEEIKRHDDLEIDRVNHESYELTRNDAD